MKVERKRPLGRGAELSFQVYLQTLKSITGKHRLTLAKASDVDVAPADPHLSVLLKESFSKIVSEVFSVLNRELSHSGRIYRPRRTCPRVPVMLCKNKAKGIHHMVRLFPELGPSWATLSKSRWKTQVFLTRVHHWQDFAFWNKWVNGRAWEVQTNTTGLDSTQTHAQLGCSLFRRLLVNEFENSLNSLKKKNPNILCTQFFLSLKRNF